MRRNGGDWKFADFDWNPLEKEKERGRERVDGGLELCGVAGIEFEY